jgi:hypothetical protein
MDDDSPVISSPSFSGHGGPVVDSLILVCHSSLLLRADQAGRVDMKKE